MVIGPEEILKLLLAVVAGGIIGAEREFRDKAAGLRTIIFICLGSTLFTMLSVNLSGSGDPSRIAANVVTGIGFLGAGAILREGSRVVGLTTAAAIWVAAAVGMGIGGGEYLLVGLAVVLTVLVLALFPVVERRIAEAREARVYEIVAAPDGAPFEELEERLRTYGLRVQRLRLARTPDRVEASFEARGSRRQHDRAARELIEDPAVREVRF